MTEDIYEFPRCAFGGSSDNYLQYTEERQITYDRLVTHGYPVLPVAPAQDASKYPKVNRGNGLKEWEHCPLTPQLAPLPAFTGKNPSYLDRNGNPYLINHRQYQSRLPNAAERTRWFANPANGIGTLGGWNNTVWLDFDLKQFDGQDHLDQACYSILSRHPQLNSSCIEQTHSGGYRLAVKLKTQPPFTNFALEPGGEHRGEALGNGRFTVLAPTVGPSGQPYRNLNRGIPVEVESLEAIGIYSTKKGDVCPGSSPNNFADVAFITIPGSVSLETLGSDTSRAVLDGEDVSDDRSASLTTAIQEWYGWRNWTDLNGVSVNGTPENLAHHAGEKLGLDSDRITRILKTVNPSKCQPASLYRSGDESCWKKIRRLDEATYEAKCPDHIKRGLLKSHHSLDNKGAVRDGETNNLPSTDWNEPVSHQGEIGYWKKTEEGERIFVPGCDFDFCVERELTSEDGGGFEITIKRSFDLVERRLFIRSKDCSNPDRFVDALKAAYRANVVCRLNKSQLSALIYSRIRDYYLRDGRAYRLTERRGRQSDGVWVFSDRQFKSDGTPTSTEESGWVYAELFPDCEDVLPSPRIVHYDPTALRRYLEAKQKFLGSNFMPSLIMDGWVAATLHDQEILKQERSFPLINLHGDAGGCKSLIAESSLSLVGCARGEMVLSAVSESALFEWLKRFGSLPVILDDPPREGLSLEEVCKRAFNRFARVVRNNRQEPHGSLAITSNHLIGEKNSATRSRIIPLFLSVMKDGNKLAFPQLMAARETASGCFPDLLKLGYPAAQIKQLESELLQYLAVAHARTAKSLAIVTHYACEVVRLAGLDVDVKQWVIDTLCPLCNESQSGLDSISDFAEKMEALESQALIGEWCKVRVDSEKYGPCIALHMPTIWEVLDREFHPSYNRSVLEQVLVERGAIKGTAQKFWDDRDQTLAYKRRMITGGSIGENTERPQEPAKRNRKCLLVPEGIWGNLSKSSSSLEFVSASNSIPVPVTSSNSGLVADSNPELATTSDIQDSSSNPVTCNQKNQGTSDTSHGVPLMQQSSCSFDPDQERAIAELLSLISECETKSDFEQLSNRYPHTIRQEVWERLKQTPEGKAQRIRIQKLVGKANSSHELPQP